MKRYFVVVLKNGQVLDFDKMCDSVNYTDDRYILIKHTPDPMNCILLAIIGHDEIAMVLAKEDYA